ncbi:type II toxin-antitoxin system HicB family antitoxin [Azospirillum halopraeferens]|uniref:type II toxin-antitoxin system HicB family antitoxin n=1 Tax=Azospirillum halopraeferens TaxID=34010 RepID=UPI00048B79F7|nr:type II toxin-antitoxin system HicB family antitoxin [Azospirillum halopraeferens]
MGARYYPIILERTEDGLSASFPDLPGCVTFGESSEAVLANAEAALALHLAGMVEDGDPIPEPSRLEDVARDPEVEEAGRLLVRADLPGKAIRINITMDEGLLAAIDAEAKRRETSRSGFLAAAARRELIQQAGR